MEQRSSEKEVLKSQHTDFSLRGKLRHQCYSDLALEINESEDGEILSLLMYHLHPWLLKRYLLIVFFASNLHLKVKIRSVLTIHLVDREQMQNKNTKHFQLDFAMY